MAEGKVMTTTSTDFQRNIGLCQDGVVSGRYAAVVVTSHGRPQVAIISYREYEELIEARRQLAWTRLARLTDEPAKTEG